VHAYAHRTYLDVTLLTRCVYRSFMVFYEVTLEVDPLLSERLTAYMRDNHIPGIYQTGCFRRISFQRASSTRFRTSYQAESSTDLERYLTVHAEAFRADFQAHFPSGLTISRETWTEDIAWG
jgi:hypothetical protein